MPTNPMRLLLRTKISSTVLPDDLYLREMILGNIEDALFVKDASGNLLSFTPTNDSTMSPSSSWSSEQVFNYINQRLAGLSWQTAVTDIIDPTGGLPANTSGSAYIAIFSGNGWVANSIYRSNSGISWVEVLPETGDAVWVDNQSSAYVFNGTTWVKMATIFDHNSLYDLQGGNSVERYHLTKSEHDGLTQGNPASNLHIHNDLYYTQTQIDNFFSGPGAGSKKQVNWPNVINVPYGSSLQAGVVSLDASSFTTDGYGKIALSSGVISKANSDAGTVIPTGHTLNILGDSLQGVHTTGNTPSDNNITVTVQNASTTQKGVAQFNPTNFAVSGGYVSFVGGGAGQVGGPMSSTNNGIVIWDGTNGNLISDSSVTITSNYGIIIPGDASVGGTLYLNGTPLELNSLSDVNVAGQSNGSALVWNSGSSKWVAGGTTGADTSSVHMIYTDASYCIPITNIIYLNGDSSAGVVIDSSGNHIIITINNATGTQKGVASFSSDFTGVSGNISLNNTIATPGTYTSVTVNNKGLVTGGTSPTLHLNSLSDVSSSSPTTAQILIYDGSGHYANQTMSQDGSLSYDGKLTLPTVNSSPGSFSYPTVNAKGLVTGGSNAAVISGGTIDSSPIGNTTRSTGKFTTIDASGNINVESGFTYNLNGSQITTSALSDSTNIALLNNTSNYFTGYIGIGITPVSTIQLNIGPYMGSNIVRLNGDSSSSNCPVLSFDRSGSSEWAISNSNDANQPLLFCANPTGYTQANLTSAYVMSLDINGNLAPKGNCNIGSGKFFQISGVQITSAALSDNTNILKASSYTGSTNIVTLGTIATGTWNGTGILPAYGGTGNTVFAQGDILFASDTTTLTRLAKSSSANQVLTNGGTSNNPAWATSSGGVTISTALSDTTNIAYLNGSNTFTAANTFSNAVLNLNDATIATTDTTMSLFPANLVTLLAFSAATSVTMGAGAGATGTLSFATKLNLNSGTIDTTAATLSMFATPTSITCGGAATTYTIGAGTGATGTLAFATKLNLNSGTIDTTASTLSLFATSTSITFGGAATTYTVGAGVSATGTFAFATKINANTGTMDSTAATLSLFATPTTITFGAASTSLTIGSSSAGTLTINNPTVVGADTTVNLWNTTSTYINAFGAATTLNIGAAAGTVTVAGNMSIGSGKTYQINGVQITTGALSDSTNILLASSYTGSTNIVTLGTITTGTWHGTSIGAIYGGTGQTAYAQGDILYADTTSSVSRLVKTSTANSFLGNGGTSNNPAWSTISSSNLSDGTNILLASSYTGSSGIVTVGTISTGVWNGTGILPAHGGTGNNVFAQGDLLYASDTTTLTRLPKSTTASQVLTNGGTNNNPVWATGGGGVTISTSLTDTTNIAYLNGTNSFSAVNTFTSTIAANGATGITTTQTTFPLINATATTINFGGAGTTINIGAATGTLNLKNASTVVSGTLTTGSSTIQITDVTGNLLNAAVKGTAGTSYIVGSDGTNVAWKTPKTRPIVLTAAGGIPGVTSGCIQTQIEDTSGSADYITLDFTNGADSYAYWNLVLPADYTSGSSLTAVMHFTIYSGTVSSTSVIWSIAGASYASDSTTNNFAQTALTSYTDSSGAPSNLNTIIQSPSITFTPAGGNAGGQYAIFKIKRKGSSDTFTGVARLLAVKLEYTPAPY